MVRVGEYDFQKTDRAKHDHRVMRIVRHPQYNQSTYFSDIALLKVDRPIQFTNYVRPACLPDNQEFTGRNAVVVGWGSTSFGGPSSNILQQVTLPIWSNQECEQKIGLRVYEVFMCAGLKNEGGHDACQGDSGGPLLLRNTADRWSVAGIVSWGFKCAQKGVPGVYTRVSQFNDWIADMAV